MDAASLLEIRHYLHQHPEISGEEQHTAAFVQAQLKKLQPSNLYNHVGNHGLLAVFDTGIPGPCVVFRAELDALPIQEQSTFDYRSQNNGVSHLCGHDGHMTILLGLAAFLSKNMENRKGKAVLLFQPAEETAQGAKQVVEDERFQRLQPTHMFTLHNLPGFTRGTVIIKDDVFAWASIGVKLFFYGQSSHAGHPEQGRTPLPAMMDLINRLTTAQHNNENPKKELITIIHVELGEEAFGTTPGDGVVMATLRAHSDQRLATMKTMIPPMLHELEDTFGITTDIEWVEHFPTVVNHPACVTLLKQAAEAQHLSVQEVDEAFRWTEDFSFYTKHIPCGFCGLGAGVNHPPLHAATYDFPDELLELGVSLFIGVVEQLLYE